MGFKLALSGIVNPNEYDENIPFAINRVRDYLSTYSDGPVEYEITETDHGIGTSWETVTLEILSLATTGFFGIPALHKKIKDSIAGWKNIKKDVDSFIGWLRRKEEVVSYSREVAFLDALQQVEATANISELELENLLEIPGKNSDIETCFETTLLYYYLIIFREEDERLFVLLYNSKRQLLSFKVVGLDYRFLDAPVVDLTP